MNVRSGKDARRNRQEGALARLEAQIERDGQYLCNHPGALPQARSQSRPVDAVTRERDNLRAKLSQYGT